MTGARTAIAVAVLAAAAGGAAGYLGASRGDDLRVVTVREAGAATTVPVASSGRPGEFDPTAVYRAVAPGVVTVSATVDGADVDGSGFVVSADGHVLTNAHVVTNSPDAGDGQVRPGRDIYVHFQDGNAIPAKLVGYDLFDDIAVLKVDPGRQPLTPLRLGRSGELAVGDPVAVIGSPFGREQEQSLSVGVVSALGREIQPPAVDFTTPGVIQTDAAINHGNSGGPVLDRSGRVVGVAAQIATDGDRDAGSGVGFAVPIEAASRSYREILERGEVVYAWLGVATYPVTREFARQFDLPVSVGLLVNGVTAGGPAATAGITEGRRTDEYQDDGLVHPDGDVLVAIDGVALRLPSDLASYVALAEPGTRARIELVRGGKRRTVEVTLGRRPNRLPR